VIEQKITDRRQLLRTPDERRRLGRKVCATDVERAKGRERRRQARYLELVQSLWLRDVLEPVGAQGADTHALRKLIGDERIRRVRHEDLPAVGGRHDASSACDLWISVVIGGPVGGMEAHSRSERIARPGKRVEATLSRHRRDNGTRSVRKGREDRISRGRRDGPAVRRNRVAQDPVMRSELRAERPTLLARQPGAALDVGEQEGQRAGRQIAFGVRYPLRSSGLHVIVSASPFSRPRVYAPP